MNRRERILAAGVLALVGLLALRAVYGRVASAVAGRFARIVALEEEIALKQATIDAAVLDAPRIADWEARALPTDRDLAKSLYKNWLSELAVGADLEETNVAATLRETALGDVGHRMHYTLRAKGDLPALTRFLHGFYAAGHLHQIERLIVKPVDRAQLDLNFTIEALALPGADRTSALSALSGTVLGGAALADYEAISQRALFSDYVAPRPAAPRPTGTPRPRFDEGEHAVLTGVISNAGRSEAWVYVRTTGELLHLVEGDQIDVGSVQATVTRIGRDTLEFDAGGRRQVVSLGQPLTEATAAP